MPEGGVGHPEGGGFLDGAVEAEGLLGGGLLGGGLLGGGLLGEELGFVGDEEEELVLAAAVQFGEEGLYPD